ATALRQSYPKRDRKEARRNDSSPAWTPTHVPRIEPTTLTANRMPSGRRCNQGRTPGCRRERIMAHLLLIDDDPALIPGQLRPAFPALAPRVEVAASGAEGLERVGARPPDVILLDLGLPDQSGLEVYQHIRRIDARIPVIFVTLAKTADAAIEAM